MKILGRKLTLKEFEEYVQAKDFGVKPPTFMVLHHTWKPTLESWNGRTSIYALKAYYERLGWSAGPHLFVTDDAIWLFTDMYDVGIHAGAGNGTVNNGYSIGIEVVGNYDGSKWSSKTAEMVTGAMRSLMGKLKLTNNDIKFHRDFSSKSCPGSAITKEYVYNLLKGETMEKEFIESIEEITGDDYGKNINENEQKDAAKDLTSYRKAHENLEINYEDALKDLSATRGNLTMCDEANKKMSQALGIGVETVEGLEETILTQRAKIESLEGLNQGKAEDTKILDALKFVIQAILKR